MDVKIGQSHRARKRLFAKGLRQRFLTVEEIEDALPSGSMTAAERWLLYYSLRAAQVEVRGELPEAHASPGS
ncbi:MAG: RNA polymerase sigma factor region1.1 domain-containing protein [Deltaproteobacteria bacterium]